MTALKELRKEHNLSQQQLADKIGATRSSVSKWENGTQVPSEIQKKIDEIFEIPKEEIKVEEQPKEKVEKKDSEKEKLVGGYGSYFTNKEIDYIIKASKLPTQEGMKLLGVGKLRYYQLRYNVGRKVKAIEGFDSKEKVDLLTWLEQHK